MFSPFPMKFSMPFLSKSLLILSVFLLFSKCNSSFTGKEKTEKKYLIAIENKAQVSSTLLLQQIIGNAFKKIDSVNISPDTKDYILSGKLPEGGFYRIELKGKAAYVFALDQNNVSVTIAGTSEMPTLNLYADGVNSDFEAIATLQNQFKQKFDSLNQAYILAENLKQYPVIANIEQAYKTAELEQKIALKNLIRKQEKTFVSVYAASFLEPEEDFLFLDTLAKALNVQRFDNDIIKDFVSKVEKLRTLAVGGMAQDLVGYSPDGRIIKLSQYKGKYVLIDFWASWCVPCRKANPEIVKIYNKYKSQNFEILGVSLDNNIDKWKQAIAEDKLDWNHISDLKGWDSEHAQVYSIEAIPQTFLIDPNGKILAKNLSPKASDSKLNELLNAVN
jgi:thiol-disulfide isomerase/thioredoxin